MLNVKMCNGSHAAFDELMLGKFCRSQPTLKIFHLETDSSARDSTFQTDKVKTSVKMINSMED